MANFSKAIQSLLQREGGDTITNDPNDAGGLTHWGITLVAYQEHGADLTGDGLIDAEDLRVMQAKDAAEFYDSEYWDKIKLDDLSSQGCAEKCFDVSVNMGQQVAAKFLQQACGATVDGQVGPKTLLLANAMDPKLLMDNLVEDQTNHYWAITMGNVERKALLPIKQGGLGWKSSWKDIAVDACRSRNLQSISILLASIKSTPGTLQGNIRFIKGWLSRAGLRFGL